MLWKEMKEAFSVMPQTETLEQNPGCPNFEHILQNIKAHLRSKKASTDQLLANIIAYWEE